MCSTKISFPFAGIGGPNRAAIEGGWLHEPVNVLDWDAKCIEVLTELHGAGVAKQRDIHTYPASSWEPSDGLMAGSPCVAFSRIGRRGGFDTAEGRLFLTLLERVQTLSHGARPLRWCVLEMVKGIQSPGKGDNPLSFLKEWWAREMPHWTDLAVWDLCATKAGLPQRRQRLFLVAFSRDFADLVGGLPEKPEEMPMAPLEGFLGVSGMYDVPSKGSNNERHLAVYQNKFREAPQGVAPPSYAIMNVSRDPTKKTFSNQLHKDVCPTLTTKNSDLYILAAIPNSKVPAGGRFLSGRERARLSGVVHDSCARYLSSAQLIKGDGNCIPVDLAGRVLEQVMGCWLKFERRIVELHLGVLAPGASQLPNDSDQDDAEEAADSEPQWPRRKRAYSMARPCRAKRCSDF